MRGGITGGATCPTAAPCVECGEVFRFDGAFYQAKGIEFPRRCRACVGTRRSRSIEVEATIERAELTYVFARGADGVTYYLAPNRLCRALFVGDLVTLLVDPESQRPGRRPVALLRR